MGASEDRLRALKRRHGEALRQRFGAHGIGVGRKRVAGRKTGDLCFVFYVSDKRPAQVLGEQAIPARLSLEANGTGEQVEVLTDVVEAPPAQFE